MISGVGLVGEPASGFLEVPGGRLYYEVGGDPDEAAVLFIHGMSLDTRMWEDQWSAFAERYRVVRLDLRGFGKSTSEATPFSDIDDLVGLLDHLGIERVHVVGLSMGARVIVDFALAHPERVHALVSADGVLSGFGPLPAEVLDVSHWPPGDALKRRRNVG